MKTNGHIKEPNGLIHATATAFDMWALGIVSALSTTKNNKCEH